MHLTLPQNVSQNMARAKSLVRRGEPARAIEALLLALEAYEPAQTIGKARAVAEVGLAECVADLNANAVVRTLLGELAGSDKAAVTYTPGDEGKVALVLQLILKALLETENRKTEAAKAAVAGDMEARFTRAEAAITAGELPRGRAMLRKLAEEYGGEEGVLLRVAGIFQAANLQYEAMEFLELAAERFPKDAAVRRELVACYRILREFEKAEKVYLATVREFGRHPRTLANLGSLYLEWNKRDKAFLVLNDARRLAPDDEEIQTLFAKADRR